LQEKILTVPATVVDQLTNMQEGLIYVELRDIETAVKKYGVFVDRDIAESDERFRQVIPYVVVMNDDKILLLRRTDKQGEKRLHNKFSVGVGGHIRREDGADPWCAFLNGMKREIDEEVKVDLLDLQYIGLINDLQSPVSRVHVGVAYIATATFHGLNEPDMFEYWWKALNEIRVDEKNLEGWSYLTILRLKELTQS
jgi:predicted NUDIX family phosphoesterase